MSESSTSAKQLSHVSFCYSRLAHAVRTPLSVSLSVLDDLSQGYAISPTDLKDARDSLTSINLTLNHLCDLARTPSFNPVSCSLTELRRLTLESLEDLTASSIAKPDSQHVSDEVFLDRELFQCLVRSLRTWAKVRQEKSDSVEILWDLPFSKTPCVKLTLANEVIGKSLSGLGSHDLSALVAADHSAQSIGLLYASLICSLHRWNTQVTSDGRILTITIELSEAALE